MRRLTIVGFIALSIALIGALWLAHRVDWATLYLRGVSRRVTANWITIHLKDGSILRLDLQDDEMLENVQPEPFPDGHSGSVGRWVSELQSMPKEEGPAWPAWLAPYPGAELIPDSPPSSPPAWANLSGTERRGASTQRYRTAEAPERVTDHYRQELEREGIAVTGQTRAPADISGLRGESPDQLRTVELETHAGGYSVTYMATEHGKFTPLPDAPVLELTLASIDEADQFVRLRNRPDGEILRLPFNCLTSEGEFKKLREVRAAKRPDFLPPFPGGREIAPPEEEPNMVNIALDAGAVPPTEVASFYKQRVGAAGFKLEREDSGVDRGRPYAGFNALAADGGRVVFSAFQTEGETIAQVMYFKPRVR